MKNNKIYKTIGEVAKEINTNTHTLRFWEKEFKQIKPKILSGKKKILFGKRNRFTKNNI